MNMDEFGQKARDAARSQYDAPKFEKASAAVQALGDALNGGSKDAVLIGALAGLLSTHRYLSNEMVVVLLTMLGEFGSMEEAMVSDGRNEYAYKLCVKLRTAFKDDLFWRDK